MKLYMKLYTKSYKIVLAFALALLLASCREDTLGNGEPELPGDTFVGDVREMSLGPETAGFHSEKFTLVLMAPDGSLIRRTGIHRRSGDRSRLTLDTGLCDGVFRLMYLEYPIEENSALADLKGEFDVAQFGLGSRVEIADGHVAVLDSYDEEIGLPGKGTEEEPYEITSYSNLIKLAQTVNSEEKNALITSDTHFRQTGKIDMYQASREVDRRYGWQPIGASSALPFRGHYHGAAISTLIIDRPNSAGVGLFGYVHNAAFDGVSFTNSAISGNFATGTLVGASLVGGNDRGIVTMTDCHVSGCEITGSDGSVAVGGLLGVADMHTRAYFQNCSSEDNEITASYNAGGLAGGAGMYSCVAFSDCSNSSPVTAAYAGAGGLVGTCDSLYTTACSNAGIIRGATGYNGTDTKNSGIGAGGLAGGSGMATLTSSSNSGQVSGYAGVGGLVGSTRVKGSDAEAYMYNNVVARYCWNEGTVSGTDCVGGIMGEAQAGTYAVYNTGPVTGNRYVAGIAGCTSIAVTHNSINTGEVSGVDYVSGIVGKTQFGSIALNHNYGKLTGSGSHLGGIVALAGNNTIIHYCGNFGEISSTGKGPVGGIVGEIGDPRKWTAMNIAECVIGSMEVVMGFVGPLLAITEHPIAAASKTLKNFLRFSEVATDAGLLISDTVLWGMGVDEMIEEEEVAELEATLNEKSVKVNEEIKAKMKSMRAAATYTSGGFDSMALADGYLGQLESTLGYYESDGGELAFNEKINLTREERAGYLEKVHKTNEIIHQVVSGVCIIVGTAASIGGIVLSGGAAAPFVVAGSLASIAGGLNAITKSCMEFEENAVFITQCINAGRISAASGDVGGLVGRLQDNSIIRDCLNTAGGPANGQPFIGKAGNNVKAWRMLSLDSWCSWDRLDGLYSDCTYAIYYPSAGNQTANDLRTYGIWLMKDADVTNPTFYKGVDEKWDVGTSESARWRFGSSATNTFPVPAWSEMRE